MTFTRRQTFLGAAAVASVASLDALAQTHFFKAIQGDDGAPVPNYLVPADLKVDGLPGVVWTGAESADVILVEFSDYNCPFCRRAAGDLETILKQDSEVRLAIVNNPILSPNSVQAARVQQGVLKTYGPRAALALHLALFGARQPNNHTTALASAKRLGLDADKIEAAAAGDDVGRVLERQIKLAESLGFTATPSFLVKTVGILGYPGPATMRNIIGAVRRCDQIVCG